MNAPATAQHRCPLAWPAHRVGQDRAVRWPSHSAGRWRSSASTRPWSTAAWTSAPPNPRRRAGRGAAPPDRHPGPAAGLQRGRVCARRQRLMAEIQSRGRTRCWWAAPCCTSRRCCTAWTTCPRPSPRCAPQLEAEAAANGWPALHAELALVDPTTAARLAPTTASASSARWRCTAPPAGRSVSFQHSAAGGGGRRWRAHACRW
jgi:hypothetical protein